MLDVIFAMTAGVMSIGILIGAGFVSYWHHLKEERDN